MLRIIISEGKQFQTRKVIYTSRFIQLCTGRSNTETVFPLRHRLPINEIARDPTLLRSLFVYDIKINSILLNDQPTVYTRSVSVSSDIDAPALRSSLLVPYTMYLHRIVRDRKFPSFINLSRNLVPIL